MPQGRLIEAYRTPPEETLSEDRLALGHLRDHFNAVAQAISALPHPQERFLAQQALITSYRHAEGAVLGIPYEPEGEAKPQRSGPARSRRSS